ncbi:MAG: bifunctional metallophosphatase/5'-nucleotidase, partial [Atopobiaceae bacterium]|nr:bifunctional metallophosphatase/5'-nucleotidase [Atopobiaceae bacterium]
DWEAQGYEVLLVDAGDATQGMPLVDTKHGSTAIAFMNSCGYDLMAVGNHEFDWGQDNLAAIESQADFPLLSANVLHKDTGEPRFTPNKVIELTDGVKMGFFGLTTPSTLTSTNPKNVADLTFLQGDELFACAQAQVDELRANGCDIVICVGHLGNDETGRGSTSKAVLEHVTGIDLFVDGHDHQEVEEEVAGTLLVETGCYMHNIGVVVVDNGVPSNEPMAYGSYDGIDAATQAIIEEADAEVEKELGVVLGETPFFLDGERDPGVRTHETNLGDFCADAFKWTAEQELGVPVDAGLVNGGGIRVSVQPGDISLKVIKSILPYSNDLSVLKVTGAQLLEALEAATQGIGQGDALGAFPQVSGITFTLDASVPYEEGPVYPDSTVISPAAPGARVRIDDVGGRGFSPDETYTLATISFLCEGGDTYYVFKEASEAEQPVTFGYDFEAFTSYLVEACDHTVPEQYAEPQGRINIVGIG